MSGTPTDANIVSAIMTEMERENGTFNEEKGEFSKQGVLKPSQHESHLAAMREELITIIQSDPELDHLINSDRNNMVKINRILNNEGGLQELLEDKSLVPIIIKDYLQTPDVDEHGEPGGPPQYNGPQEIHSIEDQHVISQVTDEQPKANAKSDPLVHDRKREPMGEESMMEMVAKANEFSFGEFMIGPVLAAVAFFLVANTPLIYYLGQIPYLGPFLVGNKLITSLALIMGIFIVGGFSIDVLGLL